MKTDEEKNGFQVKSLNSKVQKSKGNIIFQTSAQQKETDSPKGIYESP